MEKKINWQEGLIRALNEASKPQGFLFSWLGDRVPERLTIADPTDPEGIKSLVDEEVGYMRDGMIKSRDGRILGTYDRTIDYQEQPDGSILNEISFHLVNPDQLMSGLLDGEKVK
jgi:hypothetical protein